MSHLSHVNEGVQPFRLLTALSSWAYSNPEALHDPRTLVADPSINLSDISAIPETDKVQVSVVTDRTRLDISVQTDDTTVEPQRARMTTEIQQTVHISYDKHDALAADEVASTLTRPLEVHSDTTIVTVPQPQQMASPSEHPSISHTLPLNSQKFVSGADDMDGAEFASMSKGTIPSILVRDIGPEFEAHFEELMAKPHRNRDNMHTSNESMSKDKVVETSADIWARDGDVRLAKSATYVVRPHPKSGPQMAEFYERNHVLQRQLDELMKQTEELQVDLEGSERAVERLAGELLQEKSSSALSALRRRVDDLLAQTTADTLIQQLEDENKG